MILKRKLSIFFNTFILHVCFWSFKPHLLVHSTLIITQKFVLRLFNKSCGSVVCTCLCQNCKETLVLDSLPIIFTCKNGRKKLMWNF